MSIAGASCQYFSHAAHVLSNPNDLAEGIFWFAWCGTSANSWNNDIRARQKLDSQPDGVEKTQKVWQANKKALLSTFSLISGLSMVFSWLNEVKLLTLGALGPIISSFGYAGSCFVSIAKAWEALDELNQGISAYFEIQDPRAKSDMAFLQIQNMMKVAFFVTVAIWSALGSVYSLTGGIALGAAMDSCLYSAFVLFLTNLATLLALPLFLHSKKIPC